MEETKNGAAALAQITANAQNAGREIAALLEASSFSHAEKEAWAELVPYMDLALLEQFTRLLTADLSGEVAKETEDTILLMKAAQMKRDFALTHADTDAVAEMKKLEDELVALEKTGK
jgi:hypothetical protein